MKDKTVLSSIFVGVIYLVSVGLASSNKLAAPPAWVYPTGIFTFYVIPVIGLILYTWKRKTTDAAKQYYLYQSTVAIFTFWTVLVVYEAAWYIFSQLYEMWMLS